jgi:lysophospholipase L1-like esterase
VRPLRRSRTLPPASLIVLATAAVFAGAFVTNRLGHKSNHRSVEIALAAAARLTPPLTFDPALPLVADPHRSAWRTRTAGASLDEVNPVVSLDDGEKLRLASSLDASGVHFAGVATQGSVSRPSLGPSGQLSAYGETDRNVSGHRLTILQLGDSHTAADFFTGQVRERLQRVFGTGGEAYLVPGAPHLGVRSALFESSASEGWTYEALQKSDDSRRFYLSGFNAVAHRAGASLSLAARGGRAYDRLEVAFLRQPGGGRAELLIDGKPSGQIDLNGTAEERAMLDLHAAGTEEHGFREVVVRTLTDAPVTVTGVEVGRDGDGVSYISLGFPGATVQLLQKLATENVADEFRRLAPDIVVLAFGTNEGFNDALDIAAYTAQYEQIVRNLRGLRPGLRVVMVGPPDGARPVGGCHNSSVGRDCAQPPQPNAAEADGRCRFATPPKLAMVREAQRRLAERIGAEFWDWSAAMPGPCGAQVWAAANPPLMAHDYVHMTAEGYKRSADQFADFLIPLIDGGGTPTHVVSNN